MGTLFDQPPRKSFAIWCNDLDLWLLDAGDLAEKHNVSVGDVIAAKQALEAERRNNLYFDANGDRFDEQIAGIGEILRRIADAMNGLADAADAHGVLGEISSAMNGLADAADARNARSS